MKVTIGRFIKTNRGNLYVGNGDVEQIIHVSVPNYSDVGDDHRPQVPLVTKTNIETYRDILLGLLSNLERFHTPLTVETISSRGRSFRFLFSRIAPRNFNSRYILLELNALNTHNNNIIVK